MQGAITKSENQGAAKPRSVNKRNATKSKSTKAENKERERKKQLRKKKTDDDHEKQSGI